MNASKIRLTSLVHRIGHALSTPSARDRLMTTPEGADWAEASLSRDALDYQLRKGKVHRQHGEP